LDYFLKKEAMKQRTSIFVAGTIVLSCVLGITWSRTRTAGTTSATSNTVVPQRLQAAPDFQLQTWDGRDMKLSHFRGKALVLNFWATWCTPCRVEMPWLIDFAARYKDKGLEVVGISLDDGNPQLVADFVKEMKVNYTVLIGNHQVRDAYGGARFLPQTFFITPEGKINATSSGIKTKGDVENSIKKLLEWNK
jgi:cytochrome c biogenesis protein CcmG/thiol:disulfide interchange protein DsbE